jgi:hypothetical protein
VALVVFRRRQDAPPPGFRLPLLVAGVAVPGGVCFALWLLLTRSLAQVWILPALMGLGALLYAVRPGRRIASR